MNVAAVFPVVLDRTFCGINIKSLDYLLVFLEECFNPPEVATTTNPDQSQWAVQGSDAIAKRILTKYIQEAIREDFWRIHTNEELYRALIHEASQQGGQSAEVEATISYVLYQFSELWTGLYEVTRCELTSYLFGRYTVYPLYDALHRGQTVNMNSLLSKIALTREQFPSFHQNSTEKNAPVTRRYVLKYLVFFFCITNLNPLHRLMSKPFAKLEESQAENGLRLYFRSLRDPYIRLQELEAFVCPRKYRVFYQRYASTYPEMANGAVQPRSLKHLCRCTFRNSVIAKRRSTAIFKALKLPRVLESYLKLES